MLKNQKGFTLIELAIVIAILGILAIVAIPKYLDLTTDAQNGADDGVLGALKSGLAIYYAKNKAFPPDLGANGANVFEQMPQGWTLNATNTVLTCPHGPTNVTFTYSQASGTAIARGGGTGGTGKH